MIVSASHRFQLVQSCIANPGACRICMTPNYPPFADLGFSEDYSGAMYICSQCITELATTLGMLTPEQYADIESQNVRLEKENKDNARRINLLSCLGINLDSLFSLLDSDETIKLIREHAKELPESVGDEPSGTKRASKSSNVEGSGSLRLSPGSD